TERGKITLHVLLNGLRNGDVFHIATASGNNLRHGELCSQLRVDDFPPNLFLRVKRREPSHEIFQFAHIAWPWIPAHHFQASGADTLLRQSLFGGSFEKMAHKLSNVLAALA